jgi:acetyltransferase-like isoleucine patch superfamily enzyme
MRNNKFIISDFFFKRRNKLYTILITFYWRLFLGKIGRGSYIHKGCYFEGNPKRIFVGNNFKIWHRCTLAVGQGKIDFGDNGLLGVNSYINATKGNVRIGNNVAIAPFCQIYSYSHHHYPDKMIVNSFKFGDVIIEDDVFIGSNVVILPGVTIHKGAIIAASSVVNRDVPPSTIVGGAPFKVISTRK